MSARPNIKILSDTGRILNLLSNEKDYEQEYKELLKYTQNDTGIRSNTSDARLRLLKGGDVELLTTNEMGLYISSENKSTSINSEFIHLHCDDLLFTTKEDGLLWNGYMVNPLLRLMCDDDINIKILARDKTGEAIEIAPFVKKEKTQEDDVSSILKTRGEFYDADLDDDDIVDYIIANTEVNKVEYNFYDEKEDD